MPAERPDDVDEQFARLVAGYHTPPDPPAEGLTPTRPWPASEDVDTPADADAAELLDNTDDPDNPDDHLQSGGGVAVADTDPLNTQATWEDEGHFVPPQPPPPPRLARLTMLAWTGVFGSLLLAVVATLLGWVIPRWILGAMIIGFVGGIVVLIARISRDPSDPENPDDGAVV